MSHTHCVLPTSRRNLLWSAFVRARFRRAGSPGWRNRGGEIGSFLVDGPPFVKSGCVTSGCIRGLNNPGGVAAVARAQPTQRCAPLNGVPPAGLGKALATVAGAVMCEAYDLVKKWPYWQHTLVESVEKRLT